MRPLQIRSLKASHHHQQLPRGKKKRTQRQHPQAKLSRRLSSRSKTRRQRKSAFAKKQKKLKQLVCRPLKTNLIEMQCCARWEGV